jgi:acetolactate synthase-1/2/3 large subunit
MDKYSVHLASWLKEFGFTHCFFLPGGGIMHLTNAFRSEFECIPVTHEHSAVIAAEYFNEAVGTTKAFALVTSGPGVTNSVTALAGAWLEGREVLLICGQVKSSDIAENGIRQRGIQEINSSGIFQTFTSRYLQLRSPAQKSEIFDLLSANFQKKKGPIALEVCLDVQGALVEAFEAQTIDLDSALSENSNSQVEAVNLIGHLLNSAKKPLVLIGGGVSRSEAPKLVNWCARYDIPIMTTWNGIDRIDSQNDLFVGRPNTFGQRGANLLLAQTDLILVFGSRLGLQQTGFNWQEFAPCAEILQVEIEKSELEKGHPKIDYPIHLDTNLLIEVMQEVDMNVQTFKNWLNYCKETVKVVNEVVVENTTTKEYINPQVFYEELSKEISSNSQIVPCSSGGAFTTFMQFFRQKTGQTIISNKGLASMGYGLAGLLGVAIRNRNTKSILIEGDGGFLQNLNELGTFVAQNTNATVFVFSNDGYSSIRMVQESYFDGTKIGVDRESGLFLPNWLKLSEAFGWDYLRIDPNEDLTDQIRNSLKNGLIFVEVPIDPKQTYFPKITSKIMESGQIVSNPLHIMSPELPVGLVPNFSD